MHVHDRTSLATGECRRLPWIDDKQFLASAALSPMKPHHLAYTKASTTVGRGIFQIESGYSFFRKTGDGETEHSHTLPETMIRFGLTKDVEFRIRYNEVWRFGEVEDRNGSKDLYWAFKDMDILLLIAIVTLCYAGFSALVPKTILTAPIVFVLVGILLSPPIRSAIDSDAGELLEVVAELTLVILLFTDASRINAQALLREVGIPLRLLGIGLPLTIGLGAIVGKLLLPEFSWWEVALLSAILAPTDAALGQAVVSSEQVPAKIRQALNVESGLNDGIAVPFVLLFAALAATHPETAPATHWLVFWAMQVMLGPLAGMVVGVFGGRVLEAAAKRGWVDESFRKLSGIGLAILAWSGATAIGGNGFIAAFVCGMSIGCSTMVVKPAIQEFGETEGQLLSLTSFLLFGAMFVLPSLQSAGLQDWAYAVLSLTAIRILPVVVSLIGGKLQFATTMFLSWFGPRGLASLIFALLVTREHMFPHGEQLFTIAMLTATLSIVAHGVTAVPGAAWYARIVNAHTCKGGCEHEPVMEHALRHRIPPKQRLRMREQSSRGEAQS